MSDMNSCTSSLHIPKGRLRIGAQHLVARINDRHETNRAELEKAAAKNYMRTYSHHLKKQLSEYQQQVLADSKKRAEETGKYKTAQQTRVFIQKQREKSDLLSRTKDPEHARQISAYHIEASYCTRTAPGQTYHLPRITKLTSKQDKLGESNTCTCHSPHIHQETHKFSTRIGKTNDLIFPLENREASDRYKTMKNITTDVYCPKMDVSNPHNVEPDRLIRQNRAMNRARRAFQAEEEMVIRMNKEQIEKKEIFDAQTAFLQKRTRLRENEMAERNRLINMKSRVRGPGLFNPSRRLLT